MDELHPDGEREPADEQQRYEKDPEFGWSYGNHPEATAEQLADLKQTVRGSKDAFAFSLKDMPGYHGDLGPADITVTTQSPIWTPPRRFSPLECEIRDKKCQELLDAGIITKASTQNRYASVPTMPGKKDSEGNITDRRFCINYKRINDHTEPDKYVMPLPEEIFQRMHDARVFSVADLRAGFHQIPLTERSKPLTAFWQGSELNQYERMPFGLRNATAIFQRRVDYELEKAGLSGVACAFVDDIIIYSRNMEEHIGHVKAVLECLERCGFRAHPDKSLFGADAVPYLGHMVTLEGLKPHEAKVAAMVQLPTPKNVDEMRSQLGLFGYYRCYVPDFSKHAQPLYGLLKKGVKFQWGEEQEQAYATIKAALIKPGLVLRPADPKRPFKLITDWSNKGIAAVLNQTDDDGSEYMVACISRSLNVHEKRYEAWKGEVLAAVWGIKSFRPYLHGRHFFLSTDHRPLLWLLTAKNPTGQQARWLLSLQDYQFSIVHRPGVGNVADPPSRHPLPSCTDTTGARLDSNSAPLQPAMPVVLNPDGTIDTTVYDHDALAELLHIGKSNTPEAAAAAAAPETLSPFHACTTVAECSAAQIDYQHLEAVRSIGNGTLPINHIAPSFIDLLAGNAGTFMDGTECLPETNDWFLTWNQERLAKQAARWVRKAEELIPQMHVASPLPGSAVSAENAQGVRRTEQVCTRSIADSFFPAAQRGITLYEPFGGLCAGLDMLLRNGFAVNKYYYSDIDPTARKIAVHRVQHLMALYPSLLPATAVADMFTLPQDVRQVTPQYLVDAGAQRGDQWMLVGGWECQDLSQAGSSKGINGPHSSTFYTLVDILGALQQLQPNLPPAYVLENTAFQLHSNPQISKRDYDYVCSIIGSPSLLDAAQFGSRAHRVRNFWTNLCDPSQLCAAAAQVVRSEALTVQDVLEPGREAPLASQPDQAPRYQCNVPGQPMAAWPTFMAYPGSYAFRPGKQGSITHWQWDEQLYDEPSAVEREQAMGYGAESTAAPGVSEQQRRSALGRCMDANTMQCIMAIASAWWFKSTTPVQQLANQMMPTCPECAGCNHSAAMAMLQPAVQRSCDFQLQQAVAATASAQDNATGTAANTDIWSDDVAMYLLQQGSFPSGTTSAERNRVNKRLRYYTWRDNQLLRVMPDGSTKLVPAPEERQQLISKYHQQCGHFGIRSTAKSRS